MIKGIVHPKKINVFCHNLHKLFQTFMNFFVLLNTMEERL